MRGRVLIATHTVLAAVRREITRRIFLGAAWIWIKVARRSADRIRRQRCWLLGGSVGAIYGDNSAALHQYLRTHYPDIRVYWVINRDSRDVQHACAVGPVLFSDELKTYVYALLAEVHVVSHGIHDVPGSISKLSTALRVRLGHGITATTIRKPTAVAAVERANRRHDLVPVSSELEKRNKLKWGIPEDRFAITGVPRFDTLVRKQKEVASDPRRILYMPTWRDSAVRSRSAFASSRYYQGVVDLIGSPELHSVLEEFDAYLDVVFHIIARPLATELLRDFSSDRVRMPIVSDPQDLFVEAGALVTDYSSVSWDFLYIDKPVIYYQFDQDDVQSERGFHIKEGEEWPGPVLTTAEGAVGEIRRYLSGDLAADRVGAASAEKWKEAVFAFRDANNCARVADEIFLRLASRRGADAQSHPSAPPEKSAPESLAVSEPSARSATSAAPLVI